MSKQCASLSSPRFRHVPDAACAVDMQHISLAVDGGAHCHEIWTGTTYGELCQVSQRLANGCSEQVGAYHFVESRHVLVELGVGMETFGVNQISLSCGDL